MIHLALRLISMFIAHCAKLCSLMDEVVSLILAFYALQSI